MVWQNVLAQYIVVAARTGKPLGVVLAYRPSFQDRFAYVGAATFGPRKRSPAMMIGVAMFIHYVFSCWEFRKLYMETTEYNYEQFESGLGRLFEVEGRLKQHSYFGGRHWDEIILALYRDTWESYSERVLRVAWPKGYRRVTLEFPPGVAGDNR
jgi:hypothetical protein